MGYPRQEPALRRMERETRSSCRRIEDDLVAKVGKAWSVTLDSIKSEIRNEYRRDFPAGNWTITGARRAGTLLRIERRVRQLLAHFMEWSEKDVHHGLRNVYGYEVLRAAWMLDQVTPPAVKVRLSPAMAGLMGKAREADEPATWLDRWRGWVRAYGAALTSNLEMGAINDATPEDAAGVVDATRAGSPAIDPWSALERVLRTEVIDTQAEARGDVAAENDDLGIEEIWQTMGDGRVCDICADQDAHTRAEVDETIPAHPMCRCYWRLVPKAWADMLDREEANRLDDAGLVADAMAVIGPDGKPQAVFTVRFEEWQPGDRITVAGSA